MWFESEGNLEVKNNRLMMAGLDVADIAKEFGTPLYIYNIDRVVENYRRMKRAFDNAGLNASIHYSLKTNYQAELLKALKGEGAGIDAVSPNEVELALLLGFPKEKILFTSTSVSDEDLKTIADFEVLTIADSLSQIRRFSKFNPPNKSIGIRINPEFGAGSHEHIITAGKYVKFGIPESALMDAVRLAGELGFRVTGIHQHIGSGWLKDASPVFFKSVDKMISLAHRIEDFTGEPLEFIDFGGGLGVPYKQADEPFKVEDYAKGIAERFKKSGLGSKVIVEPGKCLAVDAGILVCTINTVEDKLVPLIGVNAGFNCLIRPAFYGAYHEMVVCEKVEAREKRPYMVAGNLCESSDVFNEAREKLRPLPIPEEGQHLAILNAGGHGFVMSTSNYNLRSQPKEVVVKKGKAYLARDSENLSQILR